MASHDELNMETNVFGEDIPKPTKAQIAAAKKLAPSYMKIEFGYGLKVVLPYAQGVALMQALEHAEHYDYISEGSYYVIKPLAVTDAPEFKLLSEQQYIDFKMSQLFKIKVNTQ